jgi:hypothetical protein
MGRPATALLSIECRCPRPWRKTSGQTDLSADHNPTHDCTQQVVIVVSHGRMHERIDLALRHTRLVHGRGDIAEDVERVFLPTSLTMTFGYFGAMPASVGISFIVASDVAIEPPKLSRLVGRRRVLRDSSGEELEPRRDVVAEFGPHPQCPS